MGGETRILKRGQARSRDGCLKKGGLGPPYKLWSKNMFQKKQKTFMLKHSI